MKKIAFLILILNQLNLAQSFPEWFLKIPTNSENYFIGLVRTGYYKDSSFSFAFRKAIEKAALFSKINVKLDQSFISAIDKKYWSYLYKNITYDTLAIDYYSNLLVKADSFQKSGITYVLATDNKHSKIVTSPINIKLIPKPGWIEKAPQDNKHFYAVGLAEEYYHQSSSWENAENYAILEIAKTKHLSISSNLRKENSKFLDTVVDDQNEVVFTTLYNFRIIERWYDIKSRIYYVLAKCD